MMAPLSRTVTAVTLAVCCTAAAFAPPITFALEASATSPDRISKSGSTARDLRPGSPTATKSYASWRRWRSHKGTFSAPTSGDSALQHHLGADEIEKDFVLTLPTQEQSLRGGGVSGGQAPVTTMPKQRAPRARVAFYLAVWYSFTIGYNIYNKATLNRIAAPWTLATVQLAIGSLYVCGIWLFGVRMAPKVTTKSLKAVLPLSCLHSLAHIASLMALTLGALGYFQIVKAAEPLFTALFSALLASQVFAWPVYATLLPVVGGVAVASMKELTFNWVTFCGAMTANIAGACRGVLAKGSMSTPNGENMDAGNLYGVMTIMSTLTLAPIAVIMEGAKLRGLWAAAMAAGHTKFSIVKGTVLSSLFFYMYNEVAFYCLNAIHPVTHAVANTLKRVFLIATSIVVFGHELTPVGAAGSGVAIAGVLLYSLANQKFAPPAKKHK